MATKSAQISCINKREHSSPYERIEYVGGITGGKRWRITENEAINYILQDEWDFFVSVNGRTVKVVVSQHSGHRYLKTEADGFAPNNLLNLTECPLY
ncbi:hypothetical protein CSR02_03025 [Acetobacter pomorum]|uniref:DUF3892 domain-containing protein n=1 Tax=Acetobacter pomorum TaxID=65959 RepID=A0A2G4RET2_9PROT|nr:DUF3892 domain-containing protein [Acetobacter pomorum]PHY95058.1 hypothetical protein CSR02_03025 [Acetobacter pomorum]GBR51180.1 hypothetical protein AA11825_1898 [Acetobacter pomorum DSM 11825]